MSDHQIIVATGVMVLIILILSLARPWWGPR